MIADLYTEICKFRSFQDENLDLNPNLPAMEVSVNLLLDPKTGLMFDGSTKQPSHISKTPTINSNKGYVRSWIRSVPGYSTNEIKQKELDERQALLSTYIYDVSHKNIEYLSSKYTYVNLCTGGKYAYGHLLDLFLKIMNISPNLKNVCFLISDEIGITDVQSIIKTLSQHENSIVKLISPAEKTVFFVPEVIEFKQTNGMCNFANIEEYNMFVTRILKKTTAPINSSNKVFLTRGLPLKRHIANFSDIKPILEDMGVHILYGNESFFERAWIVSQATHVCGYHGALFLDTSFCNKDAKILEYCPKLRPAKCFLRMYKEAKNYCMKFIDSDNNLNCSLNVDEILHFYKT